jgi:DNA-binding NtrC family response regulator
MWPAFAILRDARFSESASSIIQTLNAHFIPLRMRDDEDVSSRPLSVTGSTSSVVDWLHQVWQRFRGKTASEIVAVRRSIIREITDDRLQPDEPANLISAVDYLARLASAREILETPENLERPEIPATQSPLMQAAYHKLAGLAATDLPIWLSGERGTELDSLALLIHRLRGMPDDALQVWNLDEFQGADLSSGNASRRPKKRPASEMTLVVRHVDRAPIPLQKLVYDRLVDGLGNSDAYRIIVLSRSVEAEQDLSRTILPELLAFLLPTRVEIPPLRKRVEDLGALMAYFAISHGLENPVPRFTPESLDALMHYNWPGNTQELNVVTSVLLERRPSGEIGVEHLPDLVQPSGYEQKMLLSILENIFVQDRFRILRSHSDRARVAGFLLNQAGRLFTASEVQRSFNLGRETARRLLKILESQGVIEGIRGAQGKRTTRYRSRNRSGSN